MSSEWDNSPQHFDRSPTGCFCGRLSQGSVLWEIQAGGIQVLPFQKLAVGLALEVIFRPHLLVRPGAADLQAVAARGMDVERRFPPVHELALFIEGRVVIPQEPDLRLVAAFESVGELFIGPEPERVISFNQERQILERMGTACRSSWGREPGRAYACRIISPGSLVPGGGFGGNGRRAGWA
ncbi:hypothetical protein, partial [Verrucomicrobium spinosum]|uniref:hypothetical protein n=1 Tax=Verrucomicrobium spinosum TaxID=2736 RepID=UPI001C451C53